MKSVVYKIEVDSVEELRQRIEAAAMSYEIKGKHPVKVYFFKNINQF